MVEMNDKIKGIILTFPLLLVYIFSYIYAPELFLILAYLTVAVILLCLAGLFVFGVCIILGDL